MDRESAAKLLERFDGRGRRLSESSPEWMAAWRAAGRRRFVEQGLPTTKDEAWRNTPIRPVVEAPFAADVSEEIDHGAFHPDAEVSFGGPRVIVANGRVHEALSNVAAPAGVWVGVLGDAPESIRDDAVRRLAETPEGASTFRALNDALAEQVVLVHVAKGASPEAPIELQHRLQATDADAPPLVHVRSLVIVEDGASATVIERYFGVGDAPYLDNAVTDVWVGDAASLRHYRVQLESGSGHHVANTTVRAGRDASLATLTFDFGARFARHDLRAILGGDGGHAELSGLYVTRDRQHVDNQTAIDHAKPNCGSRELFKGILDGRSRTVFNGRLIVREDAQKIDAVQQNPNILLSDTALAHTRPQLEIYADDVKCTHGATIGQLDADAVFYLRSRGIPESEARRLMLTSFAGEVLDRVTFEPLREQLARYVEERLP